MADSEDKNTVQFIPRRLSIVSSRPSYDDIDYSKKSDNLSAIKALYDRQTRKANELTFIQPIQSTFSMSKLKSVKISGYDISYTISENKNIGKPKLHFARFSDSTLPHYIDKNAVTEGLNEKFLSYADTTSMTTFDNDGVSDSVLDLYEDLNCTFEGAITSMEKPQMDTVKTKEKVDPSSVQAIQSDVTQFAKIKDIWPWPWIDYRQNDLLLYKREIVNDGSTTKLPKLECPRPEHTFKRYLESIEPLVLTRQFENTKNIVEKFLKYELEQLHDKLRGYNDMPGSNWIEKTLPNYDYCYSKEGPLLMNSAIIAPFCHDVWPEKAESMLERAIVVIRLATEFWNLIRTETLKPIQDDKGNTADMEQFLDLFGSTSLPGAPKTLKCRLMKTQSQGETARHILVAYRGALFVMNVADKQYRPFPLMKIGDSLRALKNFVDSDYSEHRDSINILTTSTDGVTWAEERHRLSLIPKNQKYFSEVDHALFVLSLDHMNVNTLDQLANEAIFADGCNRWYYKGLNFYIHKNGFITLNINSKLLDGSTVAFLLHYMHLRILDESQSWDDETATMASSPDSPCSMSLAQLIKSDSATLALKEKPSREALITTDLKMLDFSLDEISHDKMYTCASIFKSISSGILAAVCKIDDFDDALFSKTSINKDAFAHLVLQLTFFRMYYRPASIGTKLSIRKFANVRYDIMRSTTKESVQWCKEYLDRDVGEGRKHTLFWIAHKKLMMLLKECVNGEGYDNHLNALRNLLELAEIPPENNVFNDESFFQSGGGDRYEIFAEMLGVGCTACPVLLPCNPKGYGVGYSLANSFLFFTVTSWEEEIAACATLFAETLKLTCQELIASPPVKPQQKK